MTTAAKIEFKAAAQFNPVFRPVNEWRGRYRILKGSAGSGKSVKIAQDYIAKLSDPAYTGANLKVANWPGVTVERLKILTATVPSPNYRLQYTECSVPMLTASGK